MGFRAIPGIQSRCEGLPTTTFPGLADCCRRKERFYPASISAFCFFFMSLLARSLAENRRTFALALPIVAGFVGQMVMGLADTIMVGRLGVTPLAAGAFANTLLAVPLVLALPRFPR